MYCTYTIIYIRVYPIVSPLWLGSSSHVLPIYCRFLPHQDYIPSVSHGYENGPVINGLPIRNYVFP